MKLTPKQQAALARLQKLKAAQSSFEGFVRLMQPEWDIPQFHLDLIDTLDKFGKDQWPTKNLLITMPPRHSKSTYCTQLFPAWFMLSKPERYVMSSSYNSELAKGFGRGVRDLFTHPQAAAAFPTAKISRQLSLSVGHRAGRRVFRCRPWLHHHWPPSEPPDRRRPDQVPRRSREHDPAQRHLGLLRLRPQHPSPARGRRHPSPPVRRAHPMAPRRPRWSPDAVLRLAGWPLASHQPACRQNRDSHQAPLAAPARPRRAQDQARVRPRGHHRRGRTRGRPVARALRHQNPQALRTPKPPRLRQPLSAAAICPWRQPDPNRLVAVLHREQSAQGLHLDHHRRRHRLHKDQPL